MALTSDNADGKGLLIGDDPKTGRPQYYRNARGLVSVAAPGSGKTQCFMLPNLLTWTGPAMVLDVTGELWRLTSKQRSKYGPVYKIDLDHPEESDHFNPFDFISADKSRTWHDAEQFATLLHSRQSSGDADGHFYDKASFGYQTALATFIKLKEPDYRQNPSTMIEYVSGASIDGFLKTAATMKDLPAMQAAVSTIMKSDDRTKGNVIWTAMNDLRPWDDPMAAGLSRMSDWRPEMIRENNATVYICISTSQLQAKPALARLIIGQHLHAFMRNEIAEKDVATTPWVQFFLDEAPQLRQMEILKIAVETGRHHNLRLWIVMQWQDQLVTAYGRETAKGMMGACGLQSYMRPSLKDGLAKELSDQLGIIPDMLNPGVMRPLFTPQELAGSDFENDVITFDHDKYVRLRQHPFHSDSRLKAMAGASD